MLLEAVETPNPPRPTLKPAAENPWYVLATIYGEQYGETFDRDLHARNRRIWNGWYAGVLPQAQMEDFAKKLGCQLGKLESPSEKKRSDIDKVFRLENCRFHRLI